MLAAAAAKPTIKSDVGRSAFVDIPSTTTTAISFKRHTASSFKKAVLASAMMRLITEMRESPK